MSGAVFLLAGAVFLCGCTGSPGEGGTSSPEITVITASSTATPEEIPPLAMMQRIRTVQMNGSSGGKVRTPSTPWGGILPMVPM